MPHLKWRSGLLNWSTHNEFNEKDGVGFPPHSLETLMGFCVGFDLRGRLWLPHVQPEGIHRKWEVEVRGEISVEHENICNESQLNSTFPVHSQFG